ncbi:MAG: phosphonoacetate hydrolase, partial [Pseudomonadota bacterium]
QDVLDDWLGQGTARVILPITDPYVVHHGALGSFATAYLPDGSDVAALAERLRALPELLEVTTRAEAVSKYDLPADRIGDLVMISTENMTIGTSADRHDLAALNEPLRSHGGLTEQEVPLIVNRVVDIDTAPRLRNFDAFQIACQAAALEEVPA